MNGQVTRLTTEAVLRLRGRAIPEFLQGQLTCDTRKVTIENAVAGAFCTPKGRVITDLIVIQLDDEQCLLRVSADLAEEVATALGRYAQFSRIAVEVDEQTTIYGLLTPADEDPADNTAPLSVRASGEGIILQRTNVAAEILSLSGEAPEGFAEDDAEFSELHWQGEILRSGHFRITKDESDSFTPQALDYDTTGRVAFDKGCYTGQEVVARLHYKGQSKKRIRAYTGSGALLDQAAGESLIAREVRDEHGASVGKVLRALPTVDGGAAFACEVSAGSLDQPLKLEGLESALEPVATP